MPSSAAYFGVNWPYVCVAFLTVAYAIFFGWLSLERYWAFQMHALDMGNMSQAAWNTVHGHPFYFTNMRLPYFGIEAWGTTTRLSFHVEALFPVISLVYLIYPHPESLLILQTLALALGAVPVFLLARDVLRNAWLAVLFAALYLLYPSLQGMNLYEFHPVALATPLLLAAFLFLYRRQPIPFVVCALCAMGTKEEIGLVVAMMALYGALLLGQKRLGISMAAIGVAWVLFAVLIVERHYRTPGAMSYVQSRYAYLGHGIHGAVNTVLHDPGAILGVLFIWPKLAYIERLLAPVGYSALLSPLSLLIGLPTFVLNLFSQDFHMYDGLGDNSAELIAVVVISGILGTRWLLGLLQRRLSTTTASILVAAYLLAQGLFSQAVNGFTPVGQSFQVPVIGKHQRIEQRFVDMIPAGVPVSTQDELDPALSDRHDTYLFLDTGADNTPGAYPGAPAARYVLLDVSGPTYPLSSWQLYDRAAYLLKSGWSVIAARDGLILLRHGHGSRSIPRAFYSFARADGAAIPHRLSGGTHGLQVKGYGRTRVDLPNHAIPSLAYTVYLRPRKRLHTDLQPVIFERMGGRLMNCQANALGLSWLPTSRWKTGHLYRVRLGPLETGWNIPGTARLTLALVPVPRPPPGDTKWQFPSCAALWREHGHDWNASTLNVQY